MAPASEGSGVGDRSRPGSAAANAHAASLRVLPCASSMASLRPEEVKKLYFRTTSGMEFAGLAPPKGSEAENMVDVHCIGQRSGKYMRYKLKCAPLHDRGSCMYTQDFVKRPLGDSATCTKLAAEIKAKQQSGGQGTSKARFQGQTKYSEDFRGLSAEQVLAAQQKSAKPDACADSGALRPSAGLLEKKSVTHEIFQRPAELARAMRAAKPRTNLMVPRKGTFLSNRTAYRDQFGPPSRPQSQPAPTRSSRALAAPATAEEAANTPAAARPRRSASAGAVRQAPAPAAARPSSSAARAHGSPRPAMASQPAVAPARAARAASAPSARRK
eukprot:TRINITY_DN11166_c0_g1_i2.p1 TRINITY_DN11166_c0_g1~~TRINITY_DN11166_c0_g1_i2.p1  ORF type:complete len:351 (+),score=77.34 TRINITY_DN11166_c0_g1_i2:68-1054(+)